jgi:hypothetical protein
MYVRAKRVPCHPALCVLSRHTEPDVPYFARIRQSDTTFRTPDSRVKQGLARWIAANDPVECDHIRLGQPSGDGDEVTVNKPNRVCSSATVGLLLRGTYVSGRRIHGDGAGHPAFHQAYRQGAKTGPDVQQRATEDAGLRDPLFEQPRRRSRPFRTKTRQLLRNSFLVELLGRLALEC